jgi:hypothetical protein
MAWKLGAVALDCPDPLALAEFYGRLLGWKITYADEDLVSLESPDGGPGLDFQRDPEYVPPTWPERGVAQMMHLDFKVPDLDAGERHALAVGARATGLPETPTTWRTYLDPAGHPFCLCHG